MDISALEQSPVSDGPVEYFTGAVRLRKIVEAPPPARVRAFEVTFAPGARTAWHTHPLGQTLFVTHGLGLVQLEGEPLRYIRPGDSVWIASGENHWHGASADHAMTHIAIQEADESGSNTLWGAKVTDAEYGSG